MLEVTPRGWTTRIAQKLSERHQQHDFLMLRPSKQAYCFGIRPT
jgi:hypothetical protein